MTIKTTIIGAAAIALMAACDNTTNEIGAILTDNLDKLNVTTDTFEISSRTILADKVVARSTIGYVGKVSDPETATYVTGDFMSQFHTLEDYTFPEVERIVSLDESLPAADSCEIRLFYTTYFGDTLATMKVTAMELSEPMLEDHTYYSDFDPIKEGFIREDGICESKTYTLVDLSVPYSERVSTDYTPNIQIPLNKTYTDKEGKTYNNYGTYVMRKYYENPENFKNSYYLTNNVLPGFYFKNASGLGAMAYISVCQLNIFFKYKKTDEDGNEIESVGTSSFAGTEEVLQTTRFSNGTKGIERLLKDNTCTYLKTPAGLFTELTLPIDDVMLHHEKDTLNTVEIVLPRLNDGEHNKYEFNIPQKLLMIPATEIYSYFENNQVVDSKTSFLATYSTSTNEYVFHNISSLIKHLYKTGNRTNENWNKVVIIPVTTTTNSEGEISWVDHDLSLSSTRLVGGSENEHKPLKMNVVYSTFTQNK